MPLVIVRLGTCSPFLSSRLSSRSCFHQHALHTHAYTRLNNLGLGCIFLSQRPRFELNIGADSTQPRYVSYAHVYLRIRFSARFASRHPPFHPSSWLLGRVHCIYWPHSVLRRSFTSTAQHSTAQHSTQPQATGHRPQAHLLAPTPQSPYPSYIHGPFPSEPFLSRPLLAHCWFVCMSLRTSLAISSLRPNFCLRCLSSGRNANLLPPRLPLLLPHGPERLERQHLRLSPLRMKKEGLLRT